MAISSPNNRIVLITGINGYIASVLGLHLLKIGYSIRGTTRRLSSTEPLLQGPYAPYVERVEIYEVPDMTIPGAFDEAVKGSSILPQNKTIKLTFPPGVNGIFHTASPIDLSIKIYSQMVIPAVSGTNTLLSSALKSGPQLETVVITSSLIAIVDPRTDSHIFTESDFASESLTQAQLDLKEHRQTPAAMLYGASKTAADRAVWKFRDEHNPPFAITTINPGVVTGPPVLLPATGSTLNETLRPLYHLLSGAMGAIPPSIGTGSFVDVRDVAYMHTWAYEHPEQSNGQRYIACAGFAPAQAYADIWRAYFISRGDPLEMNIPRGTPGEGYVGYDKETGKVESVGWAPGKPSVSGEKAEREMRFRYRSLPESAIETAEALRPLLETVA
ncbi:hypothetical protein NHQ30_006314 [Ciborinia camelliae]|nr:hypothetical protein NHQ30_006314 [Ciborinia camelliae]